MAGNDSVEVQLHSLGESVRPGESAAAIVVVDQRRARHEQIAGMNHAVRREQHHRVAVGMPTAKVNHAHFLASEPDRRFAAESDARRTGLLALHHVGIDVVVRDDLDCLG